MTIRGDDFPALCADLDAALSGLTSAAERDPSRRAPSRPRKWTAAQHVAHVGLVLTCMTDAFESAAAALHSGTLPPPPRRGPLQALFIAVIVERSFMPRGAKAVGIALPPDSPDWLATVAALRRDAGRLHAVGERLSAAERDRLWIRNPLGGVPSRATRWHYRLPEAVRLHAVHARHHARLIAEIPARR